MFQPEAKLEFVRRYCAPPDGWRVYVDIDPSEEGRTGGLRQTDGARLQQQRMQDAAVRVKQELAALGVQVGGSRANWARQHGLPRTNGDRDVVAFHKARQLCVVAEVEGASSGQPETKLYKAIGQIVMAASHITLPGWKVELVLVVSGKEMAKHLGCATALTKLGISALVLHADRQNDEWCFSKTLLPALLSQAVGASPVGRAMASDVVERTGRMGTT